MKKFELIALKKMLKETNNNLNIRGGKGYGAGHPYPKPIQKAALGTNDYDEYQEKEEQKKREKLGSSNKPVKISKAFRR